MRRPSEDLSQRHLVYALRYAIDEGKVREARSLVDRHPRGLRSRHVLHNLGARRRALLGLGGRDVAAAAARRRPSHRHA